MARDVGGPLLRSGEVVALDRDGVRGLRPPANADERGLRLRRRGDRNVDTWAWPPPRHGAAASELRPSRRVFPPSRELDERAGPQRRALRRGLPLPGTDRRRRTS